MSEYYMPDSHRKRSAVSSQSSCDDDQPPAKRAYGSTSTFNYGTETSTQVRKCSTLSSQSSCEDEPLPARRVYASSTSYENNLETSSQSEAETSQLSENTATTDGTEDSDSESDVASPTSMDPPRIFPDMSDHHNDRPSFGGASFSAYDNDLSYKSSNVSSQSLLSDGGGSSVAAKLMAQMGYQTGTGLGKHGQGRVAPVETSKQKGRRGLGMAPSEFQMDEDLAWRDEEVSCKEVIEWMEPMRDDIPDLEELKQGMSLDKRNLTIDDETEFVHPDVLDRILGSKSVFDNLEGEEMRKARTHSNPFELIRGVIFQNRAAMKMANMDSVFDSMFTSPKTRSGSSLVEPKELLYFADICAGPGGFSEYILWRKKWKCKGFGLTLKSGTGVNDFKLDEFFASPSECFEPHYGKGGIDGDGNIYDQENIEEFAKFVLDSTNQKGLHFVMADGGFSVEGQENVQEVLSKRLYLCQFLCTIAVLRDGGHFVCKLFDVFTPFSVGLIYLMRYAFDQVCLMKPVTSRPANSERYIVCKGFRAGPGRVLRQYLTYVNLAFDHVRFGTTSHKECIQHLVNIDTLKGDTEFYEYIHKSNCDLGNIQCLNLKKIQVYAKNPQLRDTRQMDIRAECINLWKVPNSIRSAPEKTDPNVKVQSLMKDQTLEPLGEATPCDMKVLQKDIKSLYDYKVFVTGTHSLLKPPSLHYYLSLGRAQVYKWDGVSSSSWKLVALDESNCALQLDIPRDTLFVAEIVQELKGEGKGQKRLYSLHITDILFLYGEDWRNYSYNARLDAARMFVSAITRPTRTRLTPIRVKQLYKIEDIPSLLSDSLDYKVVKGLGSEPRLCYTGNFHNQKNCCHAFVGLYFIPYICKPWTMACSRSSLKKYFYNTESRKSVYEFPDSAFSSSNYCLKNRLLLIDKNKVTRDKLADMTVEIDDWIKSLSH